MSRKTLVIGAALAVALSGCSHHIKYSTSKPGGGPVKKETQAFFLWGLVGGSELPLDTMCPQGVAHIDSKKGFADAILTSLTGGLYSPMSVEVTCAGGTASADE